METDQMELNNLNKEHDVLDRLLAQDVILTDMVFVYEPPIGNGPQLFDFYREAGFHFIQCHPAGDDHNISQAVQRIAAMRRQVKERHEMCVLVESVADIRAAKQADKLAVGIQLEGFRCLERNLDMVDAYHELGVRLCHPIFNIPNSIGGGCMDGNELPLTQFGKRVIERMNEVGMIVDGAHAGQRSQLDMIEYSTSPVVMSHHGLASIYAHPRNLNDEVVRACAARGGMVGVTGAGYYLGGPPTPEMLFRHIDHVVQLVGPSHVGLGLDWTANVERLEQAFTAAPDVWGSLDQWQPMAFCPPAFLRPLLNIMDEAGYSHEAIVSIAGENWIRLAEAVWPD
jgi:membrane dipeptidase